MRTVVLAVTVLGLVLGARSAAADKRLPIHVAYDVDHLDLDKHVLGFRPSRAITEASLAVIGEDGTEIGQGVATYEHPPTDAWWSISWSQPADTRVMMLKLRVAAADGVVTHVELIPWSVTIDHEDVTFRTDVAVIDSAESAKLDASLTKIEDSARRAGKFMKLALYIAGHTDTVGSAAKNRKLSLDRAVAIARYLRAKKLSVPIVVAGFGEDVLKVKTADDMDERLNRRADYVLGPAGSAPPFRGAYLNAKVAWKPLGAR